MCVLAEVIIFQSAILVSIKKSLSNYMQFNIIACTVSACLKDMSPQFAGGLLIELPESNGKLMKIM